MTDWDLRFLRLAFEVASWSKDPNAAVGAVLASPDRSQIVLGYNGFPRSMPDNSQWLADRDEKNRRTVHAEVNAVLNSPHSVRGFTCYSTLHPCEPCAILLAQAGIARIVTMWPRTDSKWRQTQDEARQRFVECGIAVRLVYDREINQ